MPLSHRPGRHAARNTWARSRTRLSSAARDRPRRVRIGCGRSWGVLVPRWSSVAVVEVELAVRVAGDSPAAFVQHPMTVPATEQRAVVEIGRSVVSLPFVEVMRFAVRGVDPAAGAPAMRIAHDHRPELIGRERPRRPAHGEHHTVGVGVHFLDVRVAQQAPRGVGRDPVPAREAALTDGVAGEGRLVGDDEHRRQVRPAGPRLAFRCTRGRSRPAHRPVAAPACAGRRRRAGRS